MEEKQITKLLLQMGITPDLKGFHYLTDAIRIWGSSGPDKTSVTKTVYPLVAEKYGVQPRVVERNIRHALDALGARVPLERTAGILGVDIEVFPDGFTNSQFIALCALKIKGEQNESI